MSGDFRFVFTLLDRLEYPDKSGSLQLSIFVCLSLDLSQSEAGFQGRTKFFRGGVDDLERDYPSGSQSR